MSLFDIYGWGVVISFFILFLLGEKEVIITFIAAFLWPYLVVAIVISAMKSFVKHKQKKNSDDV